MFEQKERSGAAKALTIFAAGLLLSLGLCGSAAMFGDRTATAAAVAFAVAGAALFMVCFVGISISLLIIVGRMIKESFKR